MDTATSDGDELVTAILSLRRRSVVLHLLQSIAMHSSRFTARRTILADWAELSHHRIAIAVGARVKAGSFVVRSSWLGEGA